MQSLLSRTAGVFALAVALASVPGTARADDDLPALAGTWIVQVTLRNCTTQDPLGPPFTSLVTFHGDRTLDESSSSLAFAPGQRSAGHGSWQRIGARTYTQRMINLLLFDTPPNPPMSPGFFAGSQLVVHRVHLSDADHFTSAGTNEFFKLNGDSYRAGCSTAVGQRFE